jgi:hypothetical protein
MDAEPNYADRRALAFDYLRERAGRAHAEGDGVLANSLSALALSQIEILGKQKHPGVNLGNVRWAFILPLYWLIDDYMIRAVDQALQAHLCPNPGNEPHLKLLRAYLFLVNQPLAPIDEQLKVLSELNFELLGDGSDFEVFVFLEHAVELAWFRGPDKSVWMGLLDAWIARAPEWCRSRLANIKTRLLLQMRLTSPAIHIRRVSSDETIAVSGDLRLAPLWIHLLNCEGKRLDEAIERIGASVSPVSHVARLLFDFHHKNRARGEFGEPQEVGLTRRRLFTASSPLMVFNELREAQLSEGLGNLFRQGRIGNAEARFHAFRLAMLSELSALRLWEFGAWQGAIKAQSQAELEAVKWEDVSVGMAADGILKAVQSLSYKPQKEDALIRTALSQLEFADEAILSGLVERLMEVYPLQEYEAECALQDLSDLVPSKLWGGLAKWGLQFSQHNQQRKSTGWTIEPLAFLTEIVQYAEPPSGIWAPLLPEFLKMAAIPLFWHSDNSQQLRAWITNAPVEMARQVGLVIVSTEIEDPMPRMGRVEILRDAENYRVDLKGAFLPELRRKAKSILEIAFLGGSTDQALRKEIKKSLLEAVGNLIRLAVPDPSSKTISIGSPLLPPFDSVDWEDDELSVLDQLVATVENPSVLSMQVPQLLSCIQQMVRFGPASFATHLLPRFESWTEQLPTGQNPTWGPKGPFSSAQFNFGRESRGKTTMMLGWIGFQLLYRIGEPAAQPIAKWIHNSVLNPERMAIPIMVYVGIPAAIHLPKGPRTDLLAACQTLLAHVLLRHKLESEYGVALANAFFYLGQLMRKEEHPLVDWNSEDARESLDLLLPKLSLALIEGSKSANPDVRASAAGFLLGLRAWMTLPPFLQQVLDKLKADNRARVRAAALSTTRDD